MGRKKPLPDGAPSGPFNAAFAELEALRSEVGAPVSDVEPKHEDASTERPDDAAAPGDRPLSALRGKVVVRRERKGHGGKTVTRIAGLGGDPDRTGPLARDLAKRLGVGAKVEGDEVWVQGDQVARLQEILPQLGAKKVIAGN